MVTLTASTAEVTGVLLMGGSSFPSDSECLGESLASQVGYGGSLGASSSTTFPLLTVSVEVGVVLVVVLPLLLLDAEGRVVVAGGDPRGEVGGETAPNLSCFLALEGVASPFALAELSASNALLSPALPLPFPPPPPTPPPTCLTLATKSLSVGGSAKDSSSRISRKSGVLLSLMILRKSAFCRLNESTSVAVDRRDSNSAITAFFSLNTS